MDGQDTKTEIQNKRINIFARDNYIIAAIPIATYTIHFAINIGYLGVFNIPSQFINFSISEILTTFTYVILALLLLYLCFRYFMNIFISKDTPRILFVKYFVISYNLAFFFILNYIYPRDYLEKYLVYLVVAIIIAIQWFIPPLFYKKKDGTYLERMVAQEEERDTKKLKNKSAFQLIVDRVIPKNLYVIVSSIYLILSFAYHLGEAYAITKENFLIINDEKDQVVLYTTDRMFISAEFDSQSKKIIENFTIYEFSGSNKISYRREKVGPFQHEYSGYLDFLRK